MPETTTGHEPFGIRAEAANAWRALADALHGTAAPCQSRPNLWTSANAGEREAAARMCRRCPALDPCDRFATANREAFGTWGGHDRERTKPRRAGHE